MARQITVEDARAQFTDLLTTVCANEGAVIVADEGRPLAVLISPEQWEQYQQHLKDQFFAVVDAIQRRNADVDPEEVEREVTAAVEEVRRERYERGR